MTTTSSALPYAEKSQTPVKCQYRKWRKVKPTPKPINVPTWSPTKNYAMGCWTILGESFKRKKGGISRPWAVPGRVKKEQKKKVGKPPPFLIHQKHQQRQRSNITITYYHILKSTMICIHTGRTRWHKRSKENSQLHTCICFVPKQNAKPRQTMSSTSINA